MPINLGVLIVPTNCRSECGFGRSVAPKERQAQQNDADHAGDIDKGYVTAGKIV